MTRNLAREIQRTHPSGRSSALGSSLASQRRVPTPSLDHSTPVGAHCACGGTCPRCQQKQPLQPKLAISRPGDALEREADQIADQVLRMSAPASSCNVESPGSRGGNAPQVQRRATPMATHNDATISGNFLQPLGPGRPLDGQTRAFFEPRFGHDFGQVRVHADGPAGVSARSLNALAYTVGHNVVFADNHFAPNTPAGQRLLAHELTHVVQQTSATGIPYMLQRQPVSDTSEEEQALSSPATCEGRRDITDTFREFVRDVPGLIASAPGLGEVERNRIDAIASFVLHSEDAADIDRYTILCCSRINLSLVGPRESVSAYVNAADRELGMLVNRFELMDEFRRTRDKEVLLRFLETIAHEKRHVTIGGAVRVPVTGLRPGRDTSAAYHAAYRVEEILTTAEEIAIQAMALRENYIVPQEEQFKLFRLRNMLRGWVTEAEYERLRALIIQQLRARYGYESGSCDNTLTVGVLHSMETNEWYTCNSATGQIVRPRAGLNLCERDGRHRLCDLRARSRAGQ